MLVFQFCAMSENKDADCERSVRQPVWENGVLIYGAGMRQTAGVQGSAGLWVSSGH